MREREDHAATPAASLSAFNPGMASKTMLQAPAGLGASSSSSSRQPLGRQGSILSLTLEELQNSMGEQGKIGSMNMDEFMKNVWSAEENQAMLSMINDAPAPPSSTTQAPAVAAGGSSSSAPPLQRQASVSIPRTLSQKTVDEVWKEIQVQKQQQQNPELSYGQITLEDFLIRAGVVKEDTDTGGVLPPIGPQGTIPGNLEAMSQSQQQQAEWFNYQVKQQQQQDQMLAAEAAGYGKRSPVGNLMIPGGVFDGGYDGGGLALSPGMGTPESKKRGMDLVVEKTVERRQRRMIKNRESAARSRARKQAYTVELEAEVTQLKEENTRLKRWQAEEAERRRKQITDLFATSVQQRLQQQEQYHPQLQKPELRRCRSFP